MAKKKEDMAINTDVHISIHEDSNCLCGAVSDKHIIMVSSVNSVTCETCLSKYIMFVSAVREKA